jgi:hypothetical protein
MRPSFQWICVLGVLLISGFAFWTGITGILDGSVAYPSKRESFLVTQAANPRIFWGCVIVWLAIGVGMVWLAAANIRELLGRA